MRVDEEPIASGMDAMKAKMARVVNYHALVARIFRRALRNEGVARKRARIKEEMLKAGRNEMLATDEDVQSGRSREDRESLANVKLKVAINELRSAKDSLTDAETFTKCVKIAADNLVEAREAIIEDLKARGLFIKSEPHRHAVGHCYRCHTMVEPRLSPP